MICDTKFFHDTDTYISSADSLSFTTFKVISFVYWSKFRQQIVKLIFIRDYTFNYK